MTTLIQKQVDTNPKFVDGSSYPPSPTTYFPPVDRIVPEKEATKTSNGYKYGVHETVAFKEGYAKGYADCANDVKKLSK